MTWSTQDYGEVVVIKPEGVIGAAETAGLKQAVTDVVSTGRKAVVLDMAEVSFIDSQGLELLLWVRDYCRLSVAQFRLAGLTENVRKILQITRLDGEFHCTAEVFEAVKSLA